MTDSADLPEKPARGRWRLWLGIVLGCVLIAAIGLGLFVYKSRDAFLNAPGPLEAAAPVLIERGASVRQIAEMLEADGVIDDARLFELGVRFFGEKTSIKAGEFAIAPGATMAQVLGALQEASQIQYRMLIREGITAAQALTIVEGDSRLVGDITGTYDEGSLLPDTYYFVRGESRDVLLARMVRAMEAAVQEAWDARTDTANLASPKDLQVLASIIEKETSRDKEKPMVSGVFHNRLTKGMRLQSDPTVIYGIAQGPLGRSLKRKDVRTPTPYNTYTIDGLPPGPIALPSRESLLAAGSPAQTEALFFVVDGKGGHVFAKTYAEHKRNIQAWLNERRKRKAKAK